MTSWSRRRLVLFTYSLLLAAAALLGAAVLLSTRSAEAGGGLAGYSAPRLAVAGLLLLPAVFFAWIAVRLAANGAFAGRVWDRLSPPWLFAAGVILLLFGWIAYYLDGFAPLAGWADYLVRLRPAAGWLAWAAALTALLAFIVGSDASGLPRILEPPVLRSSLIALAAIATVWFFIAMTGLGLRIREDYWYGAGVPALPLQVLASLVAGLVTGRLEHRVRFASSKMGSGRWLLLFDLLMCLVIWGATAILWAREPLRASFFMPGPSLPARDFYPFSDSTLYDLGSQFALIGQGLLNRQYFDRVLYMAFLTYLHGAAGQNYIQLMAVQAAIFAAFAMLLYLIGREMGSRSLGAALAVLSALRGVNSIAASTWIDLSSPKMILTDFPAAVLLALFTLLVVRWSKDPRRRWRLALWTGCALSLAVMVRTNALLLFPAVLLLALVICGFRWRPWMASATLIVLGMLLTTLPWDLLSYSRGGPLLGVYFMRIEMIFRSRYGLPLGSAQVPASSAVLHAAIPAGIREQDCTSLVCEGINHFFHNLGASVLELPVSPSLQSLRQTVKGAFPFWEQNWLGQGFQSLWGVGLAFNLALIALGVGRAWARLRWAGLAPLFIFLAYTLSNSFALTSGGRYIVPVDWIVCLYFLLGALKIAGWALAAVRGRPSSLEGPQEEVPLASDEPFWLRIRRGVITAALILLVGSLIPLSERPFPLRFVDYSTRPQTFAALEAGGLLDQTGMTREQLRAFLRNPQAAIVVGRALYPRYYWVGGGEIGDSYPYQELGFPRLAFTLIGPTGRRGVILPGELPAQFSNASDVIVLGCRNARNIDALLVFVSSEPRAIYARSPASPLTCPLRQPVCLDKVTCR